MTMRPCAMAGAPLPSTMRTLSRTRGGVCRVSGTASHRLIAPTTSHARVSEFIDIEKAQHPREDKRFDISCIISARPHELGEGEALLPVASLHLRRERRGELCVHAGAAFGVEAHLVAVQLGPFAEHLDRT